MGAMPIPNMNPTGVIGSGSGNVMPGQTASPFAAFMPSGTGTGGSGTMNFGNAANPNPTPSSANPYTPAAATGATPVSPASPVMNPGQPAQPPPVGPVPVTGQSGQTSTSPNTFDQTQRQGDRTLQELQTYYGEGMGSLIFNYLQSGAGYNSSLTQQAVDAQTNAAQQQISLGANDLTSRLGTMGVTGTGLTQSLTNYEDQAATQLNAITAQDYYNMWNQSQQREFGMLQDVSNVNATGTANQGSWMDDLAGALEIGGSFLAAPFSGGASLAMLGTGISTLAGG